MVTVDLGLAVSNDALHYREPIPDFPIVSAAEDSWRLKRRESLVLNFPALIQGQGFENVDDETWFRYAPWPEEASDGVRVTGWRRDRLGYFSCGSPREGECAGTGVHEQVALGFRPPSQRSWFGR